MGGVWLPEEQESRRCSMSEQSPGPVAARPKADPSQPASPAALPPDARQQDKLPQGRSRGEPHHRRLRRRQHPPYVWRDPFPPHVQALLVSWSNPTGTISNSDLECAASLAQQDTLAQAENVAEAQMDVGSDNTPTVAWRTKGSTSTTGPAAYLLRLAALHQRQYRYKSRFFHIAGKTNAMADDASRLWHLSDAEFLAYFNATYPQSEPWQLRHLRSEMRSALTLSLLRKRATPPEILSEPSRETATSDGGRSSAKRTTSTPSSRTSMMPYPTSKSLPCDTKTLAADLASSVERYVNVSSATSIPARRKSVKISSLPPPS